MERSVEIFDVDVKILFPYGIQVAVDSFGAVDGFVTQLEFDIRIAGTCISKSGSILLLNDEQELAYHNYL